MEKQKFLMEIEEIVQGPKGELFDRSLQNIAKEAILILARAKCRHINIAKEQTYLMFAGVVNVPIGKEAINKLIDFFREEGLEITEPEDSSYRIQW